MNTTFLLMAQYNGAAVIPVDAVCRDYFSHLTVEKFVRKVSAGEIAIPLVRMESSRKAAKGVHLTDLAAYLDERRAAAIKECQQLQR
jgi:pyocin activator protein PrtN